MSDPGSERSSPPRASRSQLWARRRRYFALLAGQRIRLTAAVALMLVATVVSLAIPLAVGRLVEGFSRDGAVGPPSIDVRGLQVVASLLIAQMACSFAFSVTTARLALDTVTKLRRQLFRHLLDLPVLYFVERRAGDLSSRVTGDVGAIQHVLTWGLIAALRAVLTLIGAIILMLRMNPLLTVVVVIILPATMVLARIFGSRLQAQSRRIYEDLGRISSHVQESVAGIRTLKVFNSQAYQAERFAGMIGDLRTAGLRRAWLGALLEASLQIVLWLCLICVVTAGFYLLAQARTSSGQLVAFLLLTFRVAMPLSSLTSLFSEIQGAEAAAGRLDEILDEAPETLSTEPAPVAERAGPVSVRLENVTFRYGEEGAGIPAAVESVDLFISGGSRVGIVGPSGAGKTTLAGLILGLLRPATGRLLLNDNAYDDLGITRVRQGMAYVAQDPVLFDLSIAENIRFGFEGATDGDIEEAARLAGVLEFSSLLPAGLQSMCGEQGARLSGGQRQRISLARAFLRNPGLIVLDEPTSALDAARELAVQQALELLMKDRTTVIIAHRLSLVRDLDLIVVLNEGRVVETGNHVELMQAGGLYHALHEIQHKGARTQTIRTAGGWAGTTPPPGSG